MPRLAFSPWPLQKLTRPQTTSANDPVSSKLRDHHFPSRLHATPGKKQKPPARPLPLSATRPLHCCASPSSSSPSCHEGISDSSADCLTPVPFPPQGPHKRPTLAPLSLWPLPHRRFLLSYKDYNQGQDRSSWRQNNPTGPLHAHVPAITTPRPADAAGCPAPGKLEPSRPVPLRVENVPPTTLGQARSLLGPGGRGHPPPRPPSCPASPH